jgi:hypothetical protein
MENKQLKTIAEELFQVKDKSWGMYAFSRDILKNKVTDKEKEVMIEQAIRCGEETAAWAIEKFGTSDPWEMAEKLKLKVEFTDRGQIADRVLFALFTPPDRVEIMMEPIERLNGSSGLSELFTKEEIIKLILGHEIFHYLEDEIQGIYTRDEKVILWKFLGYENKSTLRALSEIGGMYFSRKLNQISYSPFALDILLYYNYSPDEALKMYREVLSF